MLRLVGLILRIRSNYKLFERRAKTDLLGIKITSPRWSSRSTYMLCFQWANTMCCWFSTNIHCYYLLDK